MSCSAVPTDATPQFHGGSSKSSVVFRCDDRLIIAVSFAGITTFHAT
jgi:hypothetical protein